MKKTQESLKMQQPNEEAATKGKLPHHKQVNNWKWSEITQ